MEPRLPNINSISALIDRLSIENMRIAFLEEYKVLEHKKDAPDIQKIADWDRASRAAVELRSRIKREIDQCFKEAIENRTYEYVGEVRAFDSAKIAVAVDLIDKRYQQIGRMAANGELERALAEIL